MQNIVSCDGLKTQIYYGSDEGVFRSVRHALLCWARVKSWPNSSEVQLIARRGSRMIGLALEYGSHLRVIRRAYGVGSLLSNHLFFQIVSS